MITAFLAVLGVVLAAQALRPHHPRSSAIEPPARRALLPGRAARRARRAAERAYPDAIEMIVLAVRAGYLPAAAMEVTAPHLVPEMRLAFAAVTSRTANGERFADALAALPSMLGPMAAPLADSFAAADRYGQPIAPVLERLATEARQHRRRHADTLARQLPVRMSVPLVLCTLPSFVLLAVVPLLLAALSSLHR
ncbi:MAG TPA: type II secretion system F family protein [Ilumatobacteraceae bacterium]|nr:type II secretion system F family protein [Ilumatobacteraceae bacterium]HRB02227.1 type II secretion system F family protein [Ilumatobacteraceae bacterium]